ncbi:TKL protein kinase [Phytophthora megakarya]|uniref:TKL protein kinase n=1 Tax=Phytophthora megakarya TaxID=4795 RepID=A0A225UH27_9STRA|nr:TKL protein kinase [Phytophthora megakarya]
MDAIRLNFSDEYIVQKVYTDFGCSTFSYAIVYRVTTTCESGFYESEGFRHLFHYKTMLEDDGTGTIAFYSTSDCSFLSSYSSYIVGDITTKHVTNNDDCTSDFSSDVFPGNYRWNTSNRNDIVLSDETSNQGDDGDTGGGGLSDEVFALIVFALILCAGILLVLGIVAFVISKSGRNQQQEPRENSLVVTVALDSALAANEILHYEQPDEADGGVIFATLVETLQS